MWEHMAVGRFTAILARESNLRSLGTEILLAKKRKVDAKDQSVVRIPA
jgi:hypothetical protein